MAAALPTTYHAFYGEAPPVNLEVINAYFHPTHPIDTVLGAATAGCATNSAFLCMDNNGRTFVLHRVQRFDQALNVPFDNPHVSHSFGFIGEIVGPRPRMVEVTPEYFETVTVQVPSWEVIDAWLAMPNMAETAEMVYPDEGLEELTVRRCVHLPPHLTTLLVHQRWSFRRLCLEIAGMLRQEQNPSYMPILDFIRAVGRQTLPAHFINARLPFPRDMFDELAVCDLLEQHRRRIVQHDLLGLLIPPGGAPAAGDPGITGQALLDLVEQFQGWRQDTLDQRIAKEQKEVVAVSVATKWGPINFPKLLRFLQVGPEGPLPLVYSQLAADSKSATDCSILDSAFQDACHVYEYCPMATAKLGLELRSVRFMAHVPDQVHVGLTVFAFCFGSASVVEELKAVNHQMETLMAHGNVTAPDLTKFDALMKGKVPTSILEVLQALEGFNVACRALLGPQHTFTNAVEAFRQEFRSRGWGLHLEERQRMDAKTFVKFLYQFHVHCHQWFDEQGHSELPIDGPDFLVLRNMLTNPIIWDVLLPATLVSADPKQQPPRSATTTAQAAVSTRVTNPADQLTWVKNFNVAAFRTAHPTVPKDGETEFCLSYHKRGECWSKCGNAKTHRHLAPPELQQMQAYLQQS